MTADGQKLVACWSRREPPDEHRSPATNRHGRPASSGVSTLERRIGPCLPASNVGWAGADGSWMAGAEQIKGSQLVPSCRGRRDKGALCWPRWETQMERHPPARARAETGSPQTGFPNLSRHTSRPPSLPLPAPKYPPLATTALCESNETRTSISGGKRQPRAAFFSCHGPSNISLPSPVQFCVLSRSETLVSLLPSVRRRLAPSQRPPPSPSLHRQSRPRNQNSWQTGM